VRLVCPVCGFKAISKQSLISHVAAHANSDDGHAILYAVLIKKSASRRREVVERAVEGHSCERRAFKCPFCGMEFDSIHALKIHANSIHKDELNGTVCPVCGYRSRSDRGLVQHVAMKAKVDAMHAALYVLMTRKPMSKDKSVIETGVEALRVGVRFSTRTITATMPTITIDLDHRTYSALVEEASRRGRSIVDVARAIIAEWAARREESERRGNETEES
jgi:DNA-directed RNA polymerase subunit RPC12/RpoP